MSRGNILIAVPPSDMTTAQFTITSGTKTLSAAERTSLTTPEPSDFVTLPSLDPTKCYLQAAGPTGGKMEDTAHGVASIGLPAFDYSGAWGSQRRSFYRTLISSSTAPSPWYENVLPSGTTGWTYSAGASVTTLDDDPWAAHDPLDFFISGTVSDGNLVVDFATPSASPTQGAGQQIFAVSLSSESSAPVVASFYLGEGGSIIGSALRTVTIPRGSSHGTFIVPWDASALGTANGSAAQMIVTAGASAMCIGRVRWHCDAKAAPLFDSGWKPLAYRDSVAGAATQPTPRVSHLERVVDHDATVPLSGAVSVVHMWCCDVYGDAPSQLTVGRIWGSGHVQPVNGLSPGASVSVDDSTDQKETIGGQTTGAVGVRKRVLSGNFSMLTPEEANALFWRLDYGAGISTPFMVSMGYEDADGNDTVDRPAGTFYCTLFKTDGFSLSSAPTKRTRQFAVREKL